MRRPPTWLTPKPLRRFDLGGWLAELPRATREQVDADYAKRPTPVFEDLRYTEAKPEWIALYLHCKRGQIDPRDLRHLKAIDLEYLAASPPSTDLSSNAAKEESAKLQANVTRATRELQRRYANRAGLRTAAIGATLGVLASVAVDLL